MGLVGLLFCLGCMFDLGFCLVLVWGACFWISAVGFVGLVISGFACAVVVWDLFLCGCVGAVVLVGNGLLRLVLVVCECR